MGPPRAPPPALTVGPPRRPKASGRPSVSRRVTRGRSACEGALHQIARIQTTHACRVAVTTPAPPSWEASKSNLPGKEGQRQPRRASHHFAGSLDDMPTLQLGRDAG
jgi:hypothetical protein